MQFIDLQIDNRIKKALIQLKRKELTAIQEEALPKALQNENLCVFSQTGSGKTYIFVISALQKLINENIFNETAILILAPTRELVLQLSREFQKLAKFLPFKICSLTSANNADAQKAQLRQNPEIIIATPNKAATFLNNNEILAANIKMLICDEVDQLLKLNQMNDVKNVISTLPAQAQQILCSATQISSQELQNFGFRSLNFINKKEEIPQVIQHQFICFDNFEHKQKILLHILQNFNFKKAIIFFNKSANAENLNKILNENSLKTSVLHSNLDFTERKRTIEQFQFGGAKILLATDLLARGIDNLELDLVVHFDLVQHKNDYIHRTGRAGRNQQASTSLVFVGKSSWGDFLKFKHLANFERINIKNLNAKFQGFIEQATNKVFKPKEIKPMKAFSRNATNANANHGFSAFKVKIKSQKGLNKF